jgi:hypothetical protein
MTRVDAVAEAIGHLPRAISDNTGLSWHFFLLKEFIPANLAKGHFLRH